MKKYCILIVIMMKLCCIINKNVTIQNTGVPLAPEKLYLSFRSMLFWMVTKQNGFTEIQIISFRSMLFWMVTKLLCLILILMLMLSFRSMLFWMVTKLEKNTKLSSLCCRSMLFWMVTKPMSFGLVQSSSFRSMLFWMVTKHPY